MKYLGIVKWFDETKGFGVLLTPEEGEIFLHKSNCEIDYHTIKKGDSLIFSVTIERAKKTAIEAKIPSGYEDLCFIFSYINKPKLVEVIGNHLVRISSSRTAKRRFGTSVNIFSVSITQYFERISSFDENILLYKRYFDEHYISTDKEEFIEFLQTFRSTNSSNLIHRYKSEKLLFYFLANIDKKLLFSVWRNKLDDIPQSISMQMRINNLRNKKAFVYSEEIFFKNSDSINLTELERLFEQPKGEQIITQILLKKIDTIGSIKENLFTIFKLMDKFEKQDNITKTKNAITQNTLNYFNNRNIEESNTLYEFIDILKVLKKHFDETEFSDFIKKFNNSISDFFENKHQCKSANYKLMVQIRYRWH